MLKKLFALLAALTLLAASAALADSIGLIDGRSIEITPPAGYTVTPIESEGMLLASIACEDAAAVQFMMSVAKSEKFTGYTLLVDGLSSEEYQQMLDHLTADFDSPELTVFTAEDGSNVIYVDEQGAATDYAFLFTIYNGYLAEVDLISYSGQITAENVETARTMLSSTRDLLPEE